MRAVPAEDHAELTGKHTIGTRKDARSAWCRPAPTADPVRSTGVPSTVVLALVVLVLGGPFADCCGRCDVDEGRKRWASRVLSVLPGSLERPKWFVAKPLILLAPTGRDSGRF